MTTRDEIATAYWCAAESLDRVVERLEVLHRIYPEPLGHEAVAALRRVKVLCEVLLEDKCAKQPTAPIATTVSPPTNPIRRGAGSASSFRGSKDLAT
jgi:hypothetical protein